MDLPPAVPGGDRGALASSGRRMRRSVVPARCVASSATVIDGCWASCQAQRQPLGGPCAAPPAPCAAPPTICREPHRWVYVVAAWRDAWWRKTIKWLLHTSSDEGRHRFHRGHRFLSTSYGTMPPGRTRTRQANDRANLRHSTASRGLRPMAHPSPSAAKNTPVTLARGRHMMKEEWRR